MIHTHLSYDNDRKNDVDTPFRKFFDFSKWAAHSQQSHCTNITYCNRTWATKQMDELLFDTLKCSFIHLSLKISN